MRIGRPQLYNVKYLRNWLTQETQGDFPLLGRDQWAWDNPNDLVSLQKQIPNGPFSYVLLYKIVPFVYSWVGSDSSGNREISHSCLLAVVDVIGCLVASLLPLSSILALYFIKDELCRLLSIVAFTAIFCLAVLALTKARLIEVFAATSA